MIVNWKKFDSSLTDEQVDHMNEWFQQQVSLLECGDYPTLTFIPVLDHLMTRGLIKEKDSSRIKQLLGKRFAERRVAYGISQNQLAKFCGISNKHISRAEAGEAALLNYSSLMLTLELMANDVKGKRKFEKSTMMLDFEKATLRKELV